jgi:hypothetical protein
MYIARNVQDIGSPETRLQNQSMWSVVTFLLESLVFILVGLELPYVTRSFAGGSLSSLIREAAIVFLCVVVVRVLWVIPSTYIGRIIGGWLRHSEVALPPLRWILFVGWAGVRGGDSLVIALALPFTTAAGRPFPARDQIVFSFFVIARRSSFRDHLAPLARWPARATALEDRGHRGSPPRKRGWRARRLPLAALSEIVRYLRQRHRQRASLGVARGAPPSPPT